MYFDISRELKPEEIKRLSQAKQIVTGYCKLNGQLNKMKLRPGAYWGQERHSRDGGKSVNNT